MNIKDILEGFLVIVGALAFVFGLLQWLKIGYVTSEPGGYLRHEMRGAANILLALVIFTFVIKVW